jgi:hypothetical protein
MEISASPRTLSLFEDESMLSVQAFPASQLPLPGSDEAIKMTVGSGRQLSMLLGGSTPLGAFSKILLESSAWGNSTEFSYVWRILDTKFGCSAFQLTPLEPSTLDNGYSLWRTPSVSSGDHGAQDGEERLAQGHTLGLQDQAMTPKLWPTPRANENDQGPANRQKIQEAGSSWTGQGRGATLTTAAKLWPTPTVPNGGRRNPEGTSITGQKPDGGKAQIDLREFAIRMLPTPTVQCGKNNASPSQHKRNSDPLDVVAAKMSGQTSGSLNPEFVEALMGYPIGWTELED